MFDISWTEFLLIGVVALIVIGPKELPSVLRTLGQYTRKVRSMAADFQNQFQEAMREAEMADLKKEVDDIAHGIKRFDPLTDVRAAVEATGKDIQSSLEQSPAPTAGTPPAAAGADSAGTEAVAQSAPELPPPAPNVYSREAAIVAAAIAPVVPEPVETTAKPDTTGHGG